MEYTEQKFTISFINNSPGLVVRGETDKEMEAAIKEILPIFKRFKEAFEHGKTHQPDRIEKQLIAQPCKKCGGEMVRNPKTGKIFCKEKCWLQQPANMDHYTDFN